MENYDRQSSTDVLIIGAGPSGLMAALCLSHLGVPFRIIDRRSTRALLGRADGVQVRTMEILDSFGLASAFAENSYSFEEMSLWVSKNGGGMERNFRSKVMGMDESFMHSHTAHQGHIESFFLDAIMKKSGRTVERSMAPIMMKLGSEVNNEPYLVEVTMKHLTIEEADSWHVNGHTKNLDGTKSPKPGSVRSALVHNDGTDLNPSCSSTPGVTELIRAKYVIGCDGGKSWVRKTLGFHMEGATTNSVWGVMDIIAITDFPDIRKQATILSTYGTCIIVPREGGLSRIYVQFPDETDTRSDRVENDRTSLDERNFDKMFETLRQMLAPYKMDYTYCDWWTIYRVGQRVADHFTYPHGDPRIFLAGDAVHTHTPKEGQGLNVSMQDAYNLCWKIGGVLKGYMNKEILRTYEIERRKVAQDLIRLDRTMSKALSAHKVSADDELMAAYKLQFDLGTGLHVQYEPSIAIADVNHVADVAHKLQLGKKMPSRVLTFQANALQIELISLLRADGRWRLLVFVGNINAAKQKLRVEALSKELATTICALPTVNVPSEYAGYDTVDESVLKPIAIHSQDFKETELSQFTSPFRTLHPKTGYDYNSILADPNGGAHKFYGISVEMGAMVLIRPDQFVCWKGSLDSLSDLENFLRGLFAL